MATIETKTVGDLLTASVTGEVTVKEMMSVVKTYYPNGTIKDVIWDFRNGSMRPIPSDYKAIAEGVKKTLESGARLGGKTIFVGNSADDYKLLCLYSIMAESANVPVKYYVCRTMSEALDLVEKR